MAENNNETTPQSIPTIQDYKDPQSPIHHSHLGPILAVLIIMLVFIFGGLYLWGGMLSNTPNTPDEVPLVNDEPETPRAVADVPPPSASRHRGADREDRRPSLPAKSVDDRPCDP